jgi:hypothetical protein
MVRLDNFVAVILKLCIDVDIELDRGGENRKLDGLNAVFIDTNLANICNSIPVSV